MNQIDASQPVATCPQTISVDQKSYLPFYGQVADQVREFIVSGKGGKNGKYDSKA